MVRGGGLIPVAPPSRALNQAAHMKILGCCRAGRGGHRRQLVALPVQSPRVLVVVDALHHALAVRADPLLWPEAREHLLYEAYDLGVGDQDTLSLDDVLAEGTTHSPRGWHVLPSVLRIDQMVCFVTMIC